MNNFIEKLIFGKKILNLNFLMIISGRSIFYIIF